MASKKRAGIAHNSLPGEQLVEILQRIERVREDKQTYSDDEKAIIADAKAQGYDTGAIKRLLKRREMKPQDLEDMEAIDDIYRYAVGMAKELPLFKAVGTMAVDLAARESVVNVLLLLVPTNGEILMTAGGHSVRLWRGEDGIAHSEEVRPREDDLLSPPAKSEKPPRRAAEATPDVDDEGARQLGRDAAAANVPVVKNPFPWDDQRRRLWDEGWRDVAGSDGMGPGDE